MMKKVLFILVLLMAVLAVNAQTRRKSELNMTKKDLVNARPMAGQRIQLPGLGTFTISFKVNKRSERIARTMSKGAAKMPTSKQNEGVRTALTTAELPKPILDNVATDFTGYTVKDGAKVVKDKAYSFEVNVTKGKEAGTIVYEKVEENPAPK
jgi:nucleoid DNA-binding protein